MSFYREGGGRKLWRMWGRKRRGSNRGRGEGGKEEKEEKEEEKGGKEGGKGERDSYFSKKFLGGKPPNPLSRSLWGETPQTPPFMEFHKFGPFGAKMFHMNSPPASPRGV